MPVGELVHPFALRARGHEILVISIKRATEALAHPESDALRGSTIYPELGLPAVIALAAALASRPVALARPAEVNGTGGPISYNVKFGYTGAFSAAGRGLIPAVVTALTVADDPTDSTCSLTSPNAQLIPVAVPAGTTYARFSLFDADVNPGSDIDMCVFRGATQVGSSGSGTEPSLDLP